MAFVESDRVMIREYMGAGSLFRQLWPELEDAITNVQAVGDGGTRDDNSTELRIKALIVKLQGVDGARELNVQLLFVNRADEANIDAARSMAAAAAYGRTLVGRLATQLGFSGPLHDCFSSRKASLSNEEPSRIG